MTLKEEQNSGMVTLVVELQNRMMLRPDCLRSCMEQSIPRSERGGFFRQR